MEKKYKTLITAELVEEKLISLSPFFEMTFDGYNLNHNVMPHEELVQKIPEYDVLVCEYDTVSKDVIDAATNLKIIVCCRGGIKSVVDLDYAFKKGIIVCNNPGRNANSVTDLVMGYIIDLTRNITKTNNLIHNKELTGEESTKPLEYKDTVWGLDNDSPFIKYRGDSLNHMTLGIVGFGHVGKTLIKKALAFGMKILVYDPYYSEETADESFKLVTFDELLKRSDIISVHCSLTPETEGLFSEKVFKKMKPNSYFINTSRGEIVAEDDLVTFLNNGHLRGAAIDVSIREPIPKNSRLLNAKNLIITPHIAGSSLDVQCKGTDMVIETLRSFLKKEKPKYEVSIK